MTQHNRLREIPYNYTSFSDQEIVKRFLGIESWHRLNKLRESRRTGRSARLLFEILGDMWVIARNPFIQDDLLASNKRLSSLTQTLQSRLNQIVAWANGQADALKLAHTARTAVEKFETQLRQMNNQRRHIKRHLETCTHRDNIDFGGLARVSHVTDASDWRVEYPFVVISPDQEGELPALVKSCIELDLVIIPRGGGTGYTGGAVPLHTNTAVINLEKLEKLTTVQWQPIPGQKQSVPTITAEAGVVTQRITTMAEQHKLVFAVDPTSQDACTIGGNVAMNAGGKKAVRWGTTLDNLLSWRMVTPDAQWLEVTRLNHNLGKIHETELALFKLTRVDPLSKRTISETMLELPGPSLRKSGLGKDVTDKFLGGLPGIQKEGCDGIITSATFVLHRQADYIHTLCLEFFGSDLHRAVPAIVESKDYLDSLPDVHLTGMEHLDQRYIKAIGYTTKSPRPELPKMVLLIDIVADNEKNLATASTEVIALAHKRGGEGFVADNPEASKHFWSDRSRTAAIARHTNAFKINEDVVIPLPCLAQYSESVERINIEQSLKNKLEIIDAVAEFLNTEQTHNLVADQSETSLNIFTDKKQLSQRLLNKIQLRWQRLLANLNQTARDHLDIFPKCDLNATEANESLIVLLQRRTLRVSYRASLADPLQEIFAGKGWQAIREKLTEIHQRILSRRLFIALHMHAGDGNVHTNIPVNSHDYAMMHEAKHIVEKIMALATALGGVISGEHGIGMTKIRYLDATARSAFADYKNKIDPRQYFNRDKLSLQGGLQNAYTPSLRLVQQEALILEASDLGNLNDAIKHCLRCGKCKPVCATHEPRSGLYYSPRNKILATGLIIEAFLYEEQTRRGLSLRHFEELSDVADHCTICHRCLPPCPVNIDFGEVSMQMRGILRDNHKKSLNLGTRLSMAFLNASDPKSVNILRNTVLKGGLKAQNAAYRVARAILPAQDRPPVTSGKMSLGSQIIHFVKKPLPSKIAAKTSRALLGVEDNQSIPILRNPKKITEDADAVFYFPGCGSERLFSEIALATLAMLFEMNTHTVLPPGYLCCGYPQKSNGDYKKSRQISTDNRVLFHRVANSLAYLNIQTVIVSCGTCLDQLDEYRFEQIFPGSRLIDIHEYLMEKQVGLTSGPATQYLYHDPCHSPMKRHNPIKVAEQLLGKPVLLSERCCGEAGTFAISRPDIATQVRARKQSEIHKGIAALTGKTVTTGGEVKMLTSCPACQQGLARYRHDTGIKTEYIVVELARQLLGEDWQEKFVTAAKQGGIEQVMF